MKCGHADAQFMFDRLGKALGYRTRRTWSRQLPTDGVWLLPGSELLLPDAPAVALEVAVSEGPKQIKGSIDTLAEVSPALGVLVINEREIRRSALRKGIRAEVVERQVEEKFTAARDRITRHQQRITVWSYAELEHRYRLATGEDGPETLARLTTDK
jgi:hypothetical protein